MLTWVQITELSHAAFHSESAPPASPFCVLTIVHCSALAPQPTYGYVMQGYPLGSIAKLLQDICYR